MPFQARIRSLLGEKPKCRHKHKHKRNPSVVFHKAEDEVRLQAEVVNEVLAVGRVEVLHKEAGGRLEAEDSRLTVGWAILLVQGVEVVGQQLLRTGIFGFILFPTSARKTYSLDVFLSSPRSDAKRMRIR